MNNILQKEMTRIAGLTGRPLIRYVERFLDKNNIKYGDSIRLYKGFYKNNNIKCTEDLQIFYMALYNAIIVEKKLKIISIDYRDNKMYFKFLNNGQITEDVLLEHKED